MRIIAGKFKGKKLSEFELATTRPTSDLIRGAIFDTIGFDIIDANFLDMFAGTGACGIEALSRNAKTCVFVDQNKQAVNVIKKNLNSVGNSTSPVLNQSFEKAIETLSQQNIKFDFVFLDPPYASDFAEQAIKILINKKLLSKDAVIIWEHDKSKQNYILQNFEQFKQKKYGDKFVSYINLTDVER